MWALPTSYQFMRSDDDLVLPLAEKVTRHGECFLAYSNSNKDEEVIRAFHDWVVGVIAKEWSDKII